ncbi:MAG TPA: single-stranded DNA-binding protein [Micromonosporaceae bacterium]|nr:single-stranded DNA-binding protein [Micromonosporaceae bacterium]
MFDTYVTIVGNVLTAPEWRRTTQSNTLVANFKVASTARRLDRDSKRWVDGNSLRVRVNCWRRLAEGVAASVMVGDPVVVVGRMYTRDWVDGDGNHRAIYELEAVAVGHDLSRGRGRFLRNRPTASTSSVEDAQAETRVQGEETEPVPDSEAPVMPGQDSFDDEPDFSDVPVSPAQGYDPLRALRGGGFPTAQGPGFDGAVATRPESDEAIPDITASSDKAEFPTGPTPTHDAAPDHERNPAAEIAPASDQGADEPVSGRSRRGRGRVVVPV